MQTTFLHNPTVFSGEKELERLATQNQLMRRSEAPILRELFAGKRGLNVLDIGSNNGEKTVRWFSDPAVAHVLGLEYNAALAQQAQETYGGGRFRFCTCDVEGEEFLPLLTGWMAEEGIDGFDVVYLSFVLSHLKAPEALLKCLRPLLRPGGTLLAVETDDEEATLTPEDSRFRAFLEILAQDPYAGDRGFGGRLQAVLTDCGFGKTRLCCSAISAGPGEEEKKRMIFEMFFSYLPEDIAILRAASPGDERLAGWEHWMQEHYAALRQAVCAPDSRISMGMAVVLAERM